MDIEKTADLKCISRLLVEKWHVDQIKMKITVSPERARERTPRARMVDIGEGGGDDARDARKYLKLVLFLVLVCGAHRNGVTSYHDATGPGGGAL